MENTQKTKEEMLDTLSNIHKSCVKGLEEIRRIQGDDFQKLKEDITKVKLQIEKVVFEEYRKEHSLNTLVK